MNSPLTLAYLVFEVASLPDWQRFCEKVLGLPEPQASGDGGVAWQLDDRCHRLIALPGGRDDLAALGFACADDDALDRLLDRLAAAGHPATEAGEPERAARQVRRLYTLDDPDGNRIELCVDLAAATRPFSSDAFPDGFVTGELGLGHAVLVSNRLPVLEAFYVEALGFGVTERLDTRAGPVRVQGVFLHCNRRHHSLALFELPIDKRLHHFMLQAPAVRDIGVAYERAKRLKVPLSLGLGQHPAPDDTLSFYGCTPSGFDFEIGTGTRDIEPLGWQTRRTQQTSTWGHRPRLRLQLKMAAGLLRQRLRRAGRARAGDAA